MLAFVGKGPAPRDTSPSLTTTGHPWIASLGRYLCVVERAQRTAYQPDIIFWRDKCRKHGEVYPSDATVAHYEFLDSHLTETSFLSSYANQDLVDLLQKLHDDC